jgi:hypothetical protein
MTNKIQGVLIKNRSHPSLRNDLPHLEDYTLRKDKRQDADACLYGNQKTAGDLPAVALPLYLVRPIRAPRPWLAGV